MKQSLLSSWRDVSTTLAMTVGSPSAHRREAMLKLISVLVLILTIGVGQMWADTSTMEVGSTNYPSSATGQTVSGTNSITWDVSSDAQFWNGNDGGAIHGGSNKKTVSYITFTSDDFAGKTITSVKVTARCANSAARASVTINGVAFGSQTAAYGNSLTEKEISATGVAVTGDVVVNIARSSAATGAIYVSKIIVTYSTSGSNNPTVNVDPASWNFGDVYASASASKTFSVSGTNLTSGQNLTLTAPTGYTVEPTSITVNNATLSATNVTVTKNKTIVGSNNGNLSISGGGQASAKTVALTMNIVADPTYATLPFSFTSGSGAIANTDGMEQSGLGTDYASGNPPLKFDNTGDYVIIRFNAAPKELTYDIKGNSFSGGTFKVQTSANGTDFTDLVSHTSLGDKESKKEDLASTVRYVKFIYTNKSSGNVGLGNIGISKLPTTATLTYDLNGKTSLSSGTKPGDVSNVTLNQAYTLPTSTLGATGYTFVGWNNDKDANSKLTTFTPTEATTYTLYAIWTPNTNTAYTVKHYKQNLDGTYPSSPTETDNLTGTTDASVTPARKSYTGFTAPNGQTVTILPNGSRVVTYNYTRNSYTLTWSLDGGSISSAGTAAGSVKYEASLTAPTVTKTGYTFNAWSPAVPSTMPAANSTYTATWNCKDPEIETDLSTAQVDYIKDVTATALTISASANGASLNYAWEKSANGTSGWSPVGINNSSYTPLTDEVGDQYYRCTVTNAVAAGCSSATATSTVAHIHVVAPSVCLTPSFSPATGTYVGSRNVEISSTAGATIYYTTDGSDPKTSGTRSTYSSAISVNETTTIRAYAEKAEMTASAEGSATITIKCAAPTFTPAQGAYVGTQNVVIASEYGTVYYTTDGSDPATNGTPYSTPIAVSATNTTIKAIAKKANCANSDLATASYTIACATPTFSPEEGTYTGTQNVTISSTTGATIYYTTDGSDPSSSATRSTYSSAIPVSSNTTIKAIAVKDGLSQSALGSATYSIKYTVTLNLGGGNGLADATGWTLSQGVYTKAQTSVGGSITLPDAMLSSGLGTAGWSFAGWKTSAVSIQTSDAQTFENTTYTPAGDVTLYAVYKISSGGSADYELVESDLGTAWAGEYLIAYSSTVFADGRVGGTGENAIGAAGQSVDPDDKLSGKVVAASWGDTYNVTLEEIMNGEDPTNTYVLKTKDGQYNYHTNNTGNGLSSNDKSTAADYPITVTFTSSSDIKLGLGGDATGSVFRYNSGNGGFFRYYKNCGQNAVYLYKKGAPAVEYFSNPSSMVTLTYDANEATAGSAPDAVNYTIGQTATVVAKPEGLAKTGYTFAGWNTKDDGTGTNYVNGTEQQSFTINTNTTLYAKWSKNSYTVAVASVDHTTITATPEGGSAIAENANASVAYGTVVTLGKTDDTHFTFDEWDVYATDDNTNKVSVTEIAGVYTFTVPDFNVTVSATAPIEDHKNTVTWHVNYGTSETANVYDGTPFSQLSAPAVADNAVPTCANKFMGWATAPISIDNATSSKVSWADETSVSDSNKDFYAVWATETESENATTYTRIKDAADFVAGQKIVIVTNANPHMLGNDFTGGDEPTETSNDITVTDSKYVWTIGELDNGWFQLTSGNVTLSAAGGVTSSNKYQYVANNTSDDYSWWTIDDQLETSNCFGLFNESEDTNDDGYTDWISYLEWFNNQSKWETYYVNNFSTETYFALRFYKQKYPPTYSNYITNCCLPVENALTITNANQVATGNTLTLSSTGGNGGTVVWTVEAGTGTATISEGVLTGGNLGTVTLKAHQAEYNNYCAQDAEDMTITIVAATVDVTGVTLDHTTAALLPGETIQLTATLTPGNATDQTIGWVSGTPAKATVSNAGLVTAVAKGTSTVTVTTTDGEFTDNCAVTVHGLTIEMKDETGATISAEGVTASADGRDLTASATVASKYVFYQWEMVTASGMSIPVGDEGNADITLSGTPTGDVTIKAIFYKPVTITWLVDGEDAAAGSQTLSVARGTLWSALTPAAEPAGNKLGSCANAFVGWSNSMNDELRGNGNPAPAVLFRNAQISSYDTEITKPITFRAVFATSAAGGTFNGTAGGQFYIYANVGGTYHYAKATVTSNKLESTTSVAEAALFTFTKHATEANKFTISIGDNYYAKGSGNTDLKTQAEAYWWTLSVATHGSWHLESETNGRGFMYQDYQTVSQVTSYTRKFGCYSTNNADGDDYFDVEIAGAASYSNYVTVCCTPHTITVNGNDESENKTVSADATEICDGMTVYLSRNTSCTHYNFNKWVVKYTDGEGEQTINVSEDENHSGSFTMPAYDVTVEGDWSPRNYTMTVNAPAAAKGSVSIVGGSGEGNVRDVAYKSTVTLTITENDPEHYYLRDWTIKNANTEETTTVQGNPLEIEMPGYPIEVTANFADVAYSALTLGGIEGVYSLSATLANGDPIPDATQIKSGTALKVTYALSGQNEYVGWTFSVNSVEKTAEGTTVTFNMPEEALNVSLNTRPYYMLNLSAEHGSITGVSIAGEAQTLAAQYIVHENEVVALTAAPENENYKFKDWTGATVTNNQFTVGTEDLNVKAVFELKDTYTLTLMALGREQEKIENIWEGTSIWSQISSKEAPEIAGQTFLGWSMVEDAANMIISNDDDLDIDDNYPLYAVYQAMTPCYVKVTSTDDITNGKYLIVYETGNVAFDGDLETLDAASNTIDVTINTTDDYKTIEISENTTAAEFTIDATAGTLRSASGFYIGQTSNANGMAVSETALTNNLSIDEGNFVCVGSGGAYMRYNSDANQERFRYFKSSTYTGQKAIQLYKRGGVPNPSGETASIPTLNVTTVVDADDIFPDGKAGNIIVENGGKLTIGSDLTVNDFTIKSTMGGGKSGQVTGTGALNVTGDAYIDITLGAAGKRAEQWHAFTVPFPVDAINGVFDAETGDKLANEVNYAIMDYHGDIRATGAYGWKKFRGIMTPGTFYLMTVDGERTTYRFKKTADGALVAGNTKPLYEYASSTGNNDNGWNGVGNPTLRYGKVNYSAQVLNPTSNTYETFEANETNFVVGTPFFIQANAAAASDGMTFGAASGDANYAPKRTPAKSVESIRVRFGNEEFMDKLYVSTSEDALNQYETGKDLVKMTMTNTPSVAQIFGMAYNTKLCMVNTPLVNNKAEVALELYAPADGEYTISAEEREDATVYLLYEGRIIWNLSAGAYTSDFVKGNNTGYGIRVVKAPKVTTGIENEPTSDSLKGRVSKVVIDNNVFILRDGQMFDVTGKMAK